MSWVVCINRTDEELSFIDTNHIGFEAAERLSEDFYFFIKNKKLVDMN